MIQHSVRRNSSVAMSLGGVSLSRQRSRFVDWNGEQEIEIVRTNGIRRSLLTAEMQLRVRFLKTIAIVLVFCFVVGNFASTSQLDAQLSRQKGLSDPDPDDEEPSPGRSNELPSSRRDRPKSKIPSKSKTSGIQQTSAIEEDDLRPSSPFQLDEPLAAVVIEGNSTIPQTEIEKHIKTRAGRIVTQKQIKDDVDALVRTRWFASVEPAVRRTDEGIVLVFRILERPIVRRVEYKGLKKMKQKVFDNMTQLKPGSPFDVGSNRECARRIEEHYHEKGFAFATVELEKGNDRDDREVVFLISEGPKVHVTSIKFDGNKEFIDGILKTKTRTKTRILGLFGGKYDPATIRDDIEGVKQYYHALGYFDVEIKPKEVFSDDKSKLVIHYEIAEGIRYKIRNIEVSGNQVLSEEEIRDMMKVAEGVPYSAREINKDVESIKSKYGAQGRFFSSVDAVPRWTEDEGIVDIVYKINEDKVYRVRNINVHIQGDHPHTKTNLVRNISPVQPGDLADPKKIHLMKSRLQGSQNFDTGPENGVRVETVRVENNEWINKTAVNDVARGQSSPQSGKSTSTSLKQPLPPKGQQPPSTVLSPMSGNFLGFRSWVGTDASREESRDPFVAVASHFDRIAQPVAIHDDRPAPVGDDGLSPITPIFRAQGPDLSQGSKFGYDNSPLSDPFGNSIGKPLYGDMDQLPRVEPPSFIDIDTYLSEARSGRLMFGVGVNSNAGLVGNIVLSEQNFDILRPPTSLADIIEGKAWRGGGQKFKIEAMPGTQFSRYLVDWQDPYFMDSNYNLGVSGFYSTRYFRNWYENRLGGTVRVGRQLSQRWSASGAIRLEEVDVYNPYTPTPPLLEASLGRSLLSTFRGALIHDTRDAAFNASQGHYFELSYTQAFGQFNYPRFEVEGRQHFTTYQRVDGAGKHTVTLHGQANWSGSDTPIFERFFAGGFQSFRGFAFRGVAPTQGGILVGGTFMTLGSVEYQMPVLANEMVKVVGFSDFGTVDDTVSLSNFRLSVGAGFRITVPMMGPAPIALDFGVPLMQQDTDIKQLFSFYIGMNR